MEHKQEVVYVICSSGVRVERFELSHRKAIDPKPIVSTVPPYPQEGIHMMDARDNLVVNTIQPEQFLSV